jgi:hypothetical protein
MSYAGNDFFDFRLFGSMHLPLHYLLDGWERVRINITRLTGLVLVLGLQKIAETFFVALSFSKTGCTEQLISAEIKKAKTDGS